MTDNEIVGELQEKCTNWDYEGNPCDPSGSELCENCRVWLAIQDVLELLNRKPVPHVQRIEYQMRMKPLNDFKDELRQAITNRIGGK